MPRYFFHVLNETYYAEDHEGQELADDATARLQAARTAGEILTGDLARERDKVSVTVYVDKADGTRLMTLPVLAYVSNAEASQPGGSPA